MKASNILFISFITNLEPSVTNFMSIFIVGLFLSTKTQWAGEQGDQ